MNTDWWITASGCDDLRWAEELVREAEVRFSRFRPDSVLSRLNRKREFRDPQLAAVVARGLELQRLTGGSFDIRVGAALVAAGYDRSFELMEGDARDSRPPATPAAALSVEVSGDEVRLHGPGAVDLGGIAKGWTIDELAHALDAAGVADYVIDGGGDILAHGVAGDGGAWPVGVGDALAVRLSNRAVCTSSTKRRRWSTTAGEAHHIIDPRSGAPAVGSAQTTVVIADDATTADALATATLADLERGLRGTLALGADALFERSGRWEMTVGMERWLA